MSWPTVKLGDITEIRSGVGFPVSFQGKTAGQYPFAKVGDISALARAGGRNLAHAANFINDEDLPAVGGRPFPAGTVVFAKIGEAIRQNFRAILTRPCLIDNNAVGVIPDPSIIDPSFLYRFLCQIDMYALAQSTTVPSIRKSDLQGVEMHLPSLEEQKRIAEVLDGVDALRARRRYAIALLDDLARAVFHDMFEHQQWDVCDLGSVADISSGITKGRRTDASTRPVPYLAVANVQLMHLNLTEVKIIDATEDEIERYRLLHNDLLLTEGGDPDKLGRGTLWRDEISECIHQNHIFRVRITKPSVIAPVFLNWFVASEQGRTYFLKSAKQTTGIASINATQLRLFPLATPPLHLQQQFAERVEAIEAEKAKHRAHLARLDELFNSVQSRAFAGTLFA